MKAAFGKPFASLQFGRVQRAGLRLGRYGAMAQIGNPDDTEKPIYASLLAGMSIETITFEEALKLFELPRHLGIVDGKNVEVNVGRFGPYVRYGEAFISLDKGEDIFSVTLDRAKQLIGEKKKADAPIATYQGVEVTKGVGRFGPFIKWNNTYINVPKKYNFDHLSQQDVQELIEDKLKKESEKTTDKQNTNKTSDKKTEDNSSEKEDDDKQEVNQPQRATNNANSNTNNQRSNRG